MSRKRVAAMALGLSVLLTVGLAFLIFSPREPKAIAPIFPSPAGCTQPPAEPAALASAEDAPATPEELPIEELLAESGEDPGAVYYTSRVREALREGNPYFARELLTQMKESHPSSVLVEEAEALFEGR
jgi:hypothetical protein